MKILITILSSLFITSAFAATVSDGPSAESQESITLSVEVGAMVNVSNVNDITLTNWNGAATANGEDPTLTQNLCISSNSSTTGSYGQYSIKFSDSNNFSLVNESNSNESTPFTFVFKDAQNNENTISGPTTLSNQMGSTSADCGGSTNTTLSLNILGNGKALHAGTYIDTVTMLVSPQ